MKRTTCAAAIAILAWSAGVASAQPAATPAEDTHTREGLFIGFGVGGGNISAECAPEAQDEGICGDVLEAGSVDFHIGTMLKPRLALMLDVWPMVHKEDLLTITHVITTGAARLWLTPRLWLQGGIGGAYARFQYDGIFIDEDVQTDTVFGAMIALGYEVLLRRDFALDIQLRGGTGFYEEDAVKGHSAALEVGFTWY